MKGIIIVSFGTSYLDVQSRCIKPIEDKAKSKFTSHTVRRAFTSNRIIKKLKERDGIHIDTPSEAINRMINEGYDEIIIQPLHIIPGFEYDKVSTSVRKARHNKSVSIKIGRPLLDESHHYDDVIAVLNNTLPQSESGKGIVLMGHGTEHHANASYCMLQMKFADFRDDVIIANVEGYPEYEHVEERLKSYSQLTLQPFMLVAGDHAINDMAGDEDSFKSKLNSNGVETNLNLIGLGELEGIQDIFINRIKTLIET